MTLRVNTRRLGRAAAVLAVLACGVASGAAGPRRPAHVTYTVTIDGTRYHPDALTVKVGDTVVWVNRDPFPHTVTSAAGGFDSHAIAAGASWKFTPVKVGEFPYLCTLHPTMKGVLHVDPARGARRRPPQGGTS
jgi:plastocyanin